MDDDRIPFVAFYNSWNLYETALFCNCLYLSGAGVPCRRAARQAGRRDQGRTAVGPLARVQPPRDVHHGTRPPSARVPRGGLPDHTRLGVQLRAASDGLPLLDQGRRPQELGSLRREPSRVHRPCHRARQEVRRPRVDQHAPLPGLHRGASEGADRPFRRRRDAARLLRALGHVRAPLQGHP